MDHCCLHHVEFGVQNGERTAQKFISLYKFQLVATRNSPVAKQWLLTTGRARFLLTEITSDEIETICKDPFVNLWFDPKILESPTSQESNTGKTIHDSSFNIAIEVEDLQKCVNRLLKSGVKFCKSPQCHTTEEGEVSTATIESCVGNVKHTLVQRNHYKGLFLPGFVPVKDDNVIVNGESVEQNVASGVSGSNFTHLSHVDHVTLVSEIGTSSSILSWYEYNFGMTRFIINRDDDEAEGFVISGDNIGIRLMAFEYWKCAEMGLTMPSKKHDSIKFVIAEALPGHGPNHVSTFLQQHNGPGIQHIGLHTSDIVKSVSVLRENGVKFAEPPCTYYTEVGKLREIEMIGEDVDVLRENGILVDMEADVGDSDVTNGDTFCRSKHRYLMQKFTCPLFDRDTFFLEIIQRLGASGFGSGNITALWRSVQAYMAEKNHEKSHKDSAC